MAALPTALAYLLSFNNWVIWRREKRDDRWTKPPRQSKHPERYASVGDPSTWSTYEEAVEAAKKLGLKGAEGGIGFVLWGTRVAGSDLDNCVDDGGVIAPWAQQLINLSNSYVEISPSGTGAHIIGLTESNDDVGARYPRPNGSHVEVYRNTKRFLTITGKQISKGDKLTVIDKLIEEIIRDPLKNLSRISKSTNNKNGGTAGDSTSSGIFDKKVRRMFEQGLEPEEVCETMRKHPKRYAETKAARYETQGRLLEEVQRCYDKWKVDHKEQLAVQWTNGRMPKKDVADARIAITALGVRCSYDDFHNVYLIDGFEDYRLNEDIKDKSISRLRWMIQEHFKFDPGKDNTWEAAIQLGLDNTFDPVLDYINGLKWDGKARLDSWVVKYLGCPDTELNRVIGRIVLIAAVRRVRRPGCKFDQIVILEGREGTMKSTVILILAGAENFSDQSILGVSDRQQQENLTGNWLYEIADLKGIHHADVEAVKAFASRTEDRARPAYGRTLEKRKRRCVLWATTNDKNYLKGDTGNRRWWALPTTKILINLLRRDRDQLWAEAAELEATGESLELPKHLWAEMEKAQEERLEQHPWTDILREERGTKFAVYSVDGEAPKEYEERISSSYLLGEVLKIEPGRQRVGDSKQLATCMRRLGWDGPKALRLHRSGEVVKGYSRQLDKKVIDLDEERRRRQEE